jgi:5-methylcytosine-specific restriction enzyme A
MEPFYETADEEHVAREKTRARRLRATAWWDRRVQPGVCHYCGRNVGRAALTMDHIVPLARGGRSTRGNVVPACRDCNSRKKYLLPVEWDEYLKRMAARRDQE